VALAIDASLTLSWCFEDKVTPRTEALLQTVRSEGAVVSAIWPLEVANGLLAGQRQRRVTTEKATSFAQALDALPIEVDTWSLAQSVAEALVLARRYGLTPYDASYVEVAVRRQLPLACNDGPMTAAAKAAGVEVL